VGETPIEKVGNSEGWRSGDCFGQIDSVVPVACCQKIGVPVVVELTNQGLKDSGSYHVYAVKQHCASKPGGEPVNAKQYEVLKAR
jgi:hypothetical protein